MPQPDILDAYLDADPTEAREERAATLCGLYRYDLTRFWNVDKPGALFLMLNPSKADASVDDKTIRRCRNFAKAWGCGSLTVVNLFAYRATDPKDLLAAHKQGVDVVGPENDRLIEWAIDAHRGRGDYILAAWGDNANHPALRARRDAVVRKLPLAETRCLTTTKVGEPGHPLMLPARLRPVAFEPRQETVRKAIEEVFHAA